MRWWSIPAMAPAVVADAGLTAGSCVVCLPVGAAATLAAFGYVIVNAIHEM